MDKKHPPHLKLKGYFVSKGIESDEVAGLLDIKKDTLAKKINGYEHFRWREVETICDKYGIMPCMFITE